MLLLKSLKAVVFDELEENFWKLSGVNKSVSGCVEKVSVNKTLDVV